ncbi:MAG: alpha/beta hydrolase [Clostridia bacterium]|nr:alpha/beta hydrolase [Clostridia bacterium]
MLYRWNITIPQLSGAQVRRAYLCLPRAYYEQPDRRFPVLYMFDGHNVFLDSDATYGTSWGMLDYLIRENPGLIVAAVSCNTVGNGRLIEYSPYPHCSSRLGFIPARGEETMDWLLHTFKPMIDAHVRTLPQRENTIIAGSSMGGLMALYAALCHNDHFSRAACLSPSLWTDPQAVRAMIKDANIASDTVIYMDYGSCEMGNHGENAGILADASRLLLEKGVHLTSRIVPGGMHCEASWREQIPVFMRCLNVHK